MEEVFKDIIGYEGLYQVSNYGHIRNINQYYAGGRILKNYARNNSYLFVTLYKNKNRKTYSVHRLVALHFIENIENKLYVNHKDFNKINNCVDNLEWVTRLENAQHAQKAGKFQENGKNNKGENHGMSKLTENNVKEIRKLLEEGLSQRKIAQKFHVSQTTIKDINKKRHWRHI